MILDCLKIMIADVSLCFYVFYEQMHTLRIIINILNQIAYAREHNFIGGSKPLLEYVLNEKSADINWY
jgi:hypothetical protein